MPDLGVLVLPTSAFFGPPRRDLSRGSLRIFRTAQTTGPQQPIAVDEKSPKESAKIHVSS